MIRAIYIVAEGQTEEEFVKSLIQPYFVSKYNFPNVIPSLIGRPGHQGGAVNFERYQNDIKRFLREKDVIVTSLIDFTSVKGFKYLGNLSDHQLSDIQTVIDEFDNPELINEGDQTAPSKRLKAIIPGYQKVLYGNTIALENGFQVVLDKCPRFNGWIKRLEEKVLGR